MAVTPPSLAQTFTQHFETLGNTAPFSSIRQKAIKAFQQQGLPTLKDEAYKYTPLARLLAAQVNREQSTPAKPLQSPAFYDLTAHHIRLHNGQLSTPPDVPSLVQCLTFQEAQQHPAFLAHFTQHAQSEKDPFIALNTALFEEGLFIYIPENTVLDKPLLIEHYSADNPSSRPITSPRLLIVADKHSQAHVITAWQGTGLTNAVAEVVVEEHARLDYYTLQTHLGPAAYQLQTTQCYQAQQSILNTYTFTWSGGLVRNNLYCMIDAAHTETNMYGLYCPQGQQHVDNFTTVDHRQPHTYSNELYKGIMMDEATGIFNGRIYVRPAAQKTNAFQTNNNLVLSDQATLHTKPQLEIWADDVKCSHGATTGQLDAEQLFYLQARGIPQDTARSLLRQAFVSEVLDKVPLDALKTQLQVEWAAREMHS
ncbi:MAG: Fe-S cluster assembly protein SufD [Bacteroidota bacterium]